MSSKLQLNNICRILSLVIEHLNHSDMNTDFISYILTRILLYKPKQVNLLEIIIINQSVTYFSVDLYMY